MTGYKATMLLAAHLLFYNLSATHLARLLLLPTIPRLIKLSTSVSARCLTYPPNPTGLAAVLAPGPNAMSATMKLQHNRAGPVAVRSGDLMTTRKNLLGLLEDARQGSLLHQAMILRTTHLINLRCIDVSWMMSLLLLQRGLPVDAQLGLVSRRIYHETSS